MEAETLFACDSRLFMAARLCRGIVTAEKMAIIIKEREHKSKKERTKIPIRFRLDTTFEVSEASFLPDNTILPSR